ncbi:thiol:disulfide interchange protein DsbA/DsbL [Vibrio sp. SM6]|uniref:Thiol:disulfide interchange protein n=1 Tax=Vibrio agarilyticus TaxID=2726741 RepID=A0A7X8YI94_9VIBR|nr:thiol:disulfide interchange protein DsbA/DsbL [Vibrio agarilyticus]NLS14351.1 thiol:disulfide interchange protein DsbA/DsbL [Vibrio agarilyticus]
MKKLLAFFSLCFIALSTHAVSAPFEEGEHYKVLPTKASTQPQVTKFFSFYCPACYSFTPIFDLLKQEVPEGTKLTKNHVSFMGGNMGLAFGKAYATMVVLKVEDKMTPVLFKRVQDMNKPPRNEAELRQLFIDEGIDAKKYDAAYNGFAVDSMARRFDKQFTDAGLTGVPSVVVNNKYLVQANSISSAEEYFALVNYLLKK